MKKTIAALLLLASGATGWYSCSKADLYPFICEGFRADAPEGDSAVILMPDAFTPDGDGLNDVLVPLTRHIRSLTFTVYTADQQRIFSTDQPGQGWAAPRPATKEAYYYRIEALSEKGNRVARCGSVYALSCLPAPTRLIDFTFADQLDPARPDAAPKPPTREVLQACE